MDLFWTSFGIPTVQVSLSTQNFKSDHSQGDISENFVWHFEQRNFNFGSSSLGSVDIGRRYPFALKTGVIINGHQLIIDVSMPACLLKDKPITWGKLLGVKPCKQVHVWVTRSRGGHSCICDCGYLLCIIPCSLIRDLLIFGNG